MPVGSIPRGLTTKMKMVLPIGKKRAWNLIATPKGLESWLPIKCIGVMEPGNRLEFGWRDGDVEGFQIISLGVEHSSFRLVREDGVQIRFYLHGRMTTLTLEIEYPTSPVARRSQVTEVPFWAFHLANLKSVALNGQDPRHRLRGRAKARGFID